MAASLLEVDAVAARISSNSWAAGVPASGGGSSACSSIPGFSGPLAGFVKPLEELLDMFTGDPGAVYHVSASWEQSTGNIADINSRMTALANEVSGHLQGASAEALEAALRLIAEGAHSSSNWTKAVSQALQVCVTIFESVRSLVCEALQLLSEFVGTIKDVIFGSWPWELDKKADAIKEFANDVERFVDACSAAGDNAMKAARELVRLVTDLYRAIVPFNSEIEDLIGIVVSLVPGGTPPGVPGGQGDGPFGDQYNPSREPYPGSDLEFEKDYDLGYQHQYDLGDTDMTTEELNAMFRDQFGHLFVPSRVGDNTQLNMQLTAEGQTINTSLFGLDIPEVTAGEIYVQQIEDDGFVIAASPGHPEYPGEVAFRITNEGGHAKLEVTGVYNDTILGKHDLGADVNTNGAYAIISDKSIWADMSGRIKDKLNYG